MSQSSNTKSTLATTIAKLHGDRVSWEGNELLASNRKLYEILSGCARVLEDFTGNEAALFDLGRESFKVTAKTHAALVVIKLVFGENDRRRVSAYAKVLRKAAEAQVRSGDLPDWVTKKGGVEAVRLMDAAKSDTKAAASSATGSTSHTGSASTPPAAVPTPRVNSTVRKQIAAKLKARHRLPAKEAGEVVADSSGFVVVLGRLNEDKSLDLLAFDHSAAALDAVWAAVAETSGNLQEIGS